MNPEKLPLLENDADADVEDNGPVVPAPEPRAESTAGAETLTEGRARDARKSRNRRGPSLDPAWQRSSSA